MNGHCRYFYDEEEYSCTVCGSTSEHGTQPATPAVHPDDMPTATGPDRVAQAIARDRGGWAPRHRVRFAANEDGGQG